jgi:hypothetical protein
MKKRFGICAITLVIAGLLITGAASSVMQISEENNNKELEVNILNAEMVSLKIDSFAQLETVTLGQSYSPLASIIAMGASDNTVASEGATISAGFRTIEYPENVYFTHSSDSGATFCPDASGWLLDAPPSYPEVDNTGDGRFLGSLVPHEDDYEGGALYKISISDPTVHPDGYNAVSWDFSSLGANDEHHMTDFYGVSCGAYVDADPEINDWAYGGHSFVCDYFNDQTYAEYEGLPVHTYASSLEGQAWIHWYPSQAGADYVAMDIDQETLRAYTVVNTLGDLFWFTFRYDVWNTQMQHSSGSNGNIVTDGNDTMFDVSALNNNVIIVSQREGDIYAYYSANGLASVSEIMLAEDGANPKVVHVEENKAICTFIKDGQVYVTETEDGGESWSAIEAIDEYENDNVPGVRGASDVSAVGASWVTENDDSVYFSLVGTPPPIVEITEIKGGIGVKATIANTAIPGAADATNVAASMSVTGGILGLINKNKEVTGETLAVGDSITLKSGLIIGLGPLTVEVSVTCDEGSSDSEIAEGRQILFFSML